MWWKLAIGAAVGAIIGSFAAPGYVFWVLVGIVGGYVTGLIVQKKKEKPQRQTEEG